jgi:hypothetical protein
MAPMLTEEERRVLKSFTATRGALWSALEKFRTAKKIEMDGNCADSMRSVPRGFELAADYAARADVYKLLLEDLERFADS